MCHSCESRNPVRLSPGGRGALLYSAKMLRVPFPSAKMFAFALKMQQMFPLLPPAASVDPLAGFGTRVRSQQINFPVARTSGKDHTFTCTKGHLSRRQVGHQDDQSADQIFRLVHAFDAGKDGPPMLAAQA